MEITNHDKWKFRRCIETLFRYDNEACDGSGCKKCEFYINSVMWNRLNKIRLGITE